MIMPKNHDYYNLNPPTDIAYPIDEDLNELDLQYKIEDKLLEEYYDNCPTFLEVEHEQIIELIKHEPKYF